MNAAWCPIDEQMFDPTVAHNGTPLPTGKRRLYCSTLCAGRAARERERADADARLAGALGPDGVAELLALADASGQPVIVEGMPAPRRTGGLGRLGAATRWPTEGDPW